MVLAAMGTRRNGFVVIVVIIVVLGVQGAIVGRWILVVLSVIRIVLCLLARLLSLPTLHPSLLQQTALFRKTFALLSVLDFILANESHGRVAKNVFVLAKLADPWLTGWCVKVGVLLLDTTLAGSVLV